MMASGGYQGMNLKGTNGLEGIEGVKERFIHFKNNIKRQFFIDKLQNLKNDTAKKNQRTQRPGEGTSGLDNVQYIRHEEAINDARQNIEGLGEADMSELRRIEAQLESSAREYAEKQKGNAINGEISKDDIDIGSKLY